MVDIIHLHSGQFAIATKTRSLDRIFALYLTQPNIIIHYVSNTDMKIFSFVSSFSLKASTFPFSIATPAPRKLQLKEDSVPVFTSDDLRSYFDNIATKLEHLYHHPNDKFANNLHVKALRYTLPKPVNLKEININYLENRNMATILVLNGTSSSGKTTLAKAMQQQFDSPYLLSGIDKYVFMLPGKYLNQPLWSSIFRYRYAEDGTIESIETGVLGNQLISAMHHSVKAIADSGFNVIIDHVLLEKSWLHEMISLFTKHEVWLIGVKCPIEIVEQREIDRKDRTLGQAKA